MPPIEIPTIVGPVGRAWENCSRRGARGEAILSDFLIYRPGTGEPFSYCYVGGMHLRDLDNGAKALKQYPDAAYEIILTPIKERMKGMTFSVSDPDLKFHPLGKGFRQQFHGPPDSAIHPLVCGVAKAICYGFIIPTAQEQKEYLTLGFQRSLQLTISHFMREHETEADDDL